METFKKYLPDVVVVLLFVAISLFYFIPATFEGRILFQHDSQAGLGAAREAQEYYEQTGERTRWTNATFGGMPTYQTSPSYNTSDHLNSIMNAYHLWLPDYVWYVFAYLLGFYILLRAFNFKQYLAALGAVIWAFSSYFFIIIAAGHIWKVMALAYLPPLIGGIVLAYRGKYLWGFLLTAIFTAFEVKANHVQMTYYFLFVILFMVIALLVDAIRFHRLKQFGTASLVVLSGAMIGVLLNISNLYHTWQYSKESTRSKSELVKSDANNQTNTGMDRDYITQWSYGIGETWSLLVPNVKGGASVPLANNAKAMQKANPDYSQIYMQMGQYWGEQPGTSGPVYVGAFVLMLFFLALFIVKGPMKWALLAATILSVLLSWGKNFMGFTEFFLDYIPLYAKFRTVASILVVAEFTIPLLAVMGLKKIVEQPETLKTNLKWVYVSFGLTGGIALLFYLFPGLFFSGFISSSESAALSQIPAEYLGPLKANLTEIRKYIFSADALRSFIIVTIGLFILLAYKVKKLPAKYMIGCIFLLCLIDMWQVNKRYLNDDMFVEKSVRETPQQMTATDEQILKDKALNYRVLNMASNTFNENETSYYHKSIGGYHAAKLRRYQEMIEAYIAPEMQKIPQALNASMMDLQKVDGDSVWPVLNMLNAKYFIIPLQDGQTVPLINNGVTGAFGNAWMVDKVTYVNNANEEMDMVGKIDLRHEAVADKQFADCLGQSAKQGDAVINLTSYAPNHLVYDVNTDAGGVLVFSEIYYPEWTATIDGRPADLGRVNYILRALKIAPGHHEVVLDFHPASIRTTETIAYASYSLLLVLILAGIFVEYRKNKKRSQRG